MANPTSIAAGQRFGRLVAIMRVENSARGDQQWLFKCDCGTEIVRRAAHIAPGHTKSCGCLNRELSVSRMSLARAAASVADAPVTVNAPAVASTNDTERMLGDHRIRKLVEWYDEARYRRFSPVAIAAGELDAELRAVLRREVGPDQVEVEFGRVLRIARGG
jgi:hypothetical protein